MTGTGQTSPPRRTDRGGGFGSTWTIAHVRGVPIRVATSWLVIAGLVVWVLYSRYAVLLGAYGDAAVVVASVAAGLLFFASLLAHELGHAMTSLDRDIPVRSVTLFLLGGVTESTREAKTARDELVIVGIGPFISAVLGAAFGLVYVAVEAQPVLAAIAGYLAWVNLLLAAFNLVPGYPLDGGRLLRALLWAVTGAPHRSTRMAARVGQAFALLLGGYGVYVLVLSGQGFGGFWEILLGVFLYRGAAQSHARARFRERLAGRTAGDVMGTVPPALDPLLRLSDAVVQLEARPSLLWPVGDPVVGGVTLARLDDVPRGSWATTVLRDVALGAGRVTVDARASMDLVLDRLVAAPGNMLLVVAEGRAVGLITPSLVSDLTP